MEVKFWGVVGSCPGRDLEMSKISSNTSCISVECGNRLIIFDAGSGIVQLANNMENIKKFDSIDIFITHYHYDHVIGIPFASIFYNLNLVINIHGPVFLGHNIESAVKGLFVKPYLPMEYSSLNADIRFINVDDKVDLNYGACKISCMKSDHPGGNLIYKLEYQGKRFSYLTDLGHSEALNEKIVSFSMDSDLIYYDANFLESELNDSVYEGWGHSTHEKGIKLLNDSRSHRISLGHHAIHRNFNELLELEEKYDKSKINIAREGVTIKL